MKIILILLLPLFFLLGYFSYRIKTRFRMWKFERYMKQLLKQGLPDYRGAKVVSPDGSERTIGGVTDDTITLEDE